MILSSGDVISDKSSEIVLRTSCILSILGSLIVMLACSLPDSVRKKKGRQLIFWLSVTDLGTSCVYLISTFESSDNNTPYCKTLALLGIFFPVASFLWTDFIALHIYMVITSRRLKTEKEWNRIMIYFHIIAWGLSALCIAIVAGYDHAGRDENSNSDNTGGWCWVQTSDPSMLIWWELIGGKFVEWSSCFILLPLLYSSTALTLIHLDRMHNSTSSSDPTSSRSFTMSLFVPPRPARSQHTSVEDGVCADNGQSPPNTSCTGAEVTSLTHEVHRGKFRRFYMKMVSFV